MADKIKLSGIFADGYGIVPKMVIRDSKLSSGAKILYTLFCTYSGNGESCFPSQDSISESLGMSVGTVRKKLRELEDRGIVAVEQVKENGKFSHNLYHLLRDAPVIPCDKIPSAQNTATEFFGGGELPSIKNIDSIKTDNQEYQSQKREKPTRHQYGEYKNVLLTEDDIRKLEEKHPQQWREYVERVSEYMARTGKSYKNHYLTILKWIKEDNEKSHPTSAESESNSGSFETDSFFEASLARTYGDLPEYEDFNLEKHLGV